VKPGWRVSAFWLGLFPVFLAPALCRGALELTLPGAPSRDWGVAFSSGAMYDDNFNGTEFHRISGFRYTADLTLNAKLPSQRSLLSGTYDYGLAYPANIPQLGGVTQNHLLNLSENYSLNPRTLLSLNDTFVNAVEPQLVQNQSGAPATIIQSGSYLYNLVNGTLNYTVTPRWTASLSGSWDIWRYDEAINATNFDRQDYSMTLSALYAVRPRTIVGVNYQYGGDAYTNPGFRNGLNAYYNTGYLSISHQFNPKLALVLNGGYTVRNAEDGSTSTSPSGYGSLIYNYGPLDSISLTFVQSLSTSAAGFSRSYSAEETTSMDLVISHRFTARLHTTIDGSYSYNTFTAALRNQQLQVQNASPSYQSITGHWGLGYDFRVWLSAGLDYWYTRQLSSNSLLVEPYSHDQIAIKLTLKY
jgi:hypothetical protein